MTRLRIDWQRAALDIRRHMPLQKAARMIGKHPQWLNEVARGEIAEPKFSDGVALLDLHVHLCGEDLTRRLRLP